MDKAKFTNTILTKVVKDKNGNTIFESVSTVVKFPKSLIEKKKVNVKLKIEELVRGGKIGPAFGNELFKIVKQPKMKYKNYHWYIHHEVVNFKPTFDTKVCEVNLILAVIKEFSDDKVLRKALFDKLNEKMNDIIWDNANNLEAELKKRLNADVADWLMKRYEKWISKVKDRIASRGVQDDPRCICQSW